MIKRILIKISGELFNAKGSSSFDTTAINSLITQIKHLHQQCHVSLLVGGGNFFRGEQHGTALGLSLETGHSVGMIATMMNGLILQELMQNGGLDTVMINSFSCPAFTERLNKKTIEKAVSRGQLIIFTGGTGNPYFTTDTAAVVRSLQIKADQLWKATKVDGIYNKDPETNSDAELIKRMSYKHVLERQLQIMDLTAITLAQKHEVEIKVFNLFAPEALLNAYNDPDYASTITAHSK